MIQLLRLLIDGSRHSLLHHLLLLQLRRLKGEGGGGSLVSGDVYRNLARIEAVRRGGVTRIEGGRGIERRRRLCRHLR